LALLSERGIAPGLLLAMPQLLDPNFQRAVVLMVEHGDGGSFGLVLNRPTPVEVVPGLVLSTSPEQLRELAAAPPPRLRFLMGYSGWGSGQLEFELAEGSWVHAEVEPDLIFATHPDQLWAAVLESIGIQPASLVPGTGVH
jgi:putative transcriptional regulator